MTVTAYADEDRSPLGDSVMSLAYPKQSAALYEELLGRLPEMLDSPERYRDLWGEEDGRLGSTIGAIESGAIAIEERPEIDLAIVRVPESFGPAHRMAINIATRCMRVLEVQGRSYSLRYRYESWVAYVSEPVMPRVEVGPLATMLAEREPGWRAGDIEGTDQPQLERDGDSAIAPDDFVKTVSEFLTSAV